MENYGEIGVLEFVRLMKDYLERRIDTSQYRERYFALTKKRVHIPNEDVDRIVQQAYGDADDYDPVVRLPHTIQEPELRERVGKSVKELELLGYVTE